MPERLTPNHDAPQHGPRPLPLFLDMLRSETAAYPERRAAALRGLRAYQEAARGPVREPMPAHFEHGLVRVRDYGGDGPVVLFVPSLINPPLVLDLEGASLLRWLTEQGLRPMLLDWGTPSPAERDLTLAAHVGIVRTVIARFAEPVVLAGYCLGGTIALAAACTGAPIAGLALLATPWRFDGFGERARADIAALWDAAKPGCEAMGLVPMEVLQAGFWRLDPARTIAKYEAFAAMLPGSAAARAFVALEDWANAGAPLSYAAGRDMFEDLFAADLPGRGAWAIDGRMLDPGALACPAIEFVSTTDRIVPAASAPGLPDSRALDIGHVGMIVGSRARAQLWEPLRDWLCATAGIRTVPPQSGALL